MPNAERKINSQLVVKGISTYLPLIPKITQWSDRKKTIETPLFPGYLFVKISKPTELRLVQETKGVVRFITSNGKFDVISEYELDSVRKLVTYGSHLYTGRFEIGEEIEIQSGHLKGIKGQLVRCNGVNKLHVLISSVHQCLIVEIPASFVVRRCQIEKLTTAPRTSHVIPC